MISAPQLARELTPRNFNLIVLPTEKCNFRCTYCYEDFSVGKMTPAVRQSLKRFIGQRLDGVTTFSIWWFGGEPLLALDVIGELGEYAQAECGRRNIAYSSDITTNAYRLDAATLDRLVSLGVNSFQISLDGHGEGHDQTRKLANGRGTFDTIWGNLLSMKASPHAFSTTLRIHLTPANRDSLEVLVREIGAVFGDDSRFRVFFKAIERLGGPADDNMPTLHRNEAAATMASLQSILDATKLRPASSAGRSESDTRAAGSTEPYVCYASKPGSLVIRANGTLAKCTVMLDDARNSIGRLLPDGSIEVDNARLGLWLRGFGSGDLDELGCPASSLPAMRVQPLTFVPPRSKGGQAHA